MSALTNSNSNAGLRPSARWILAVFGAVQLVNGLWAVLAPRSFYEDFPFGRGWVELLPPYSDHLLRDVGGLYLATAVVLLAAAISMTRATVLVACFSWLTFALPHAIYHAFHLEPYGAGDAIANAIVLAVAVLLPAWVLVAVARRPRSRHAVRPPEPRPGTPRIAGVPDPGDVPYVPAALWRVMEPVRVFAHHPKLLMGYGALELASERAQLLPTRLKHLAELRAGMICGCEWCLDFGSWLSTDLGIDEAELRDLPRYWESERFTDAERLALDFATGMSRSPVDVPDALFDRLREHFDEAQLVELTNIVALENYRARFNWALGIEGQDFSEGSFCVPAEAAQASDEAPR